jgi:U3 small nucleolar RNA-associated protein 10
MLSGVQFGLLTPTNRIHEYNTAVLLTTFLPYHTLPVFVTILSILPSTLPQEYRFLQPYIRSSTSPPRTMIVYQSIHQPTFLALISEYTLASCRDQLHYPTLITFWGGLMTEAVNGLLDLKKSGRQSVQRDHDQTILHQLGPIFGEALILGKCPNLQVATYMAISVFASKGSLEDMAISAFMEQLVLGWTAETVRPGLVCLAILAQYRSAKQMSSKVTKALLKVPNIGPILAEIGKERRVDKLVNGLCLAVVDRLCKRGDSRGLPIVKSVLASQILSTKQTEVVFKSLLLAAHRLSDEIDPDGRLRKELGSLLIELSQGTGDSSDIIQRVIQELEFDIEDLEIKLDVSIRTTKLLKTAQDDVDMDESLPKLGVSEDAAVVLEKIRTAEGSLPTCLSSNTGELFEEMSRLFLLIVSSQDSEQDMLTKFGQVPSLCQQSAVRDCTYFGFFIRIWSGPYPALARAAALDMVKNRLKSNDGTSTDFQALLPYSVTALNDPSRKVRKAAADLLIVLDSLYSSKRTTDKHNIWGQKQLYQDHGSLKWLGTELAARILQSTLIPILEENILDQTHILTVVQASLESHSKGSTREKDAEKAHLSQSARLAWFTFLATHIISSPILVFKVRLLNALNRIRSVASTSRTQLLLPALSWWAGLSKIEADKHCSYEKLDETFVDDNFVDVVIPNDKAGLDALFNILNQIELSERHSLVSAIFSRLKKMWGAMKSESRFLAAQTLLEMSQRTSEGILPAEAGDLLRNVELTTEVLAYFLDSIQTGAQMLSEPPAKKRRRTSSSGSNANSGAQIGPELSALLRRVTFVLQLVDSSHPVEHPELLDSLFNALSELQHFRNLVGSELGYLQNLVLGSLLGMMPAYRADRSLKIDSSRGHGDLLVNCIQNSSSPMVQNSALLLMANLASLAPELVIHSVMPIFTLMGASVLRQSDDYSAHVVKQTIKEVIPPLMDSLKKGKRNPISAAAQLLISFSTAYEHIPSHRKLDLFVSLVETLGPEEFLFAITAMLVDRHSHSDKVGTFVADLLNHFSVETQLSSLVQLLNLVGDLFKPKPGLSSVLLGTGEEKEENDLIMAAFKQLSIIPALLSSTKLSRHISKLAEQDDMEASKARELYSALLENLLSLADIVRPYPSLHTCCGSALSNLLNLLSIGEFIKAVESLLDRPNIGLRQKVLKALEVRVDQESNSNPKSRAALLAFLPQLTAVIRDSNDVLYKHTAVNCVDKIAEKYGKKDIEAVTAAAATIAGGYCLGQSDNGLQVTALLCLASLVDVLQDGIISVLPIAIATTLKYLRENLESSEPHVALHDACYAFITSVVQHLPYVISGSYLDQLLTVSNLSAETDLDADSDDNRTNCLQFVAKQVDPKVLFSGLEKNWSRATTAGYSVSNHLNILIYPCTTSSVRLTLLSRP